MRGNELASLEFSPHNRCQQDRFRVFFTGQRNVLAQVLFEGGVRLRITLRAVFLLIVVPELDQQDIFYAKLFFKIGEVARITGRPRPADDVAVVVVKAL